MIQSRCSSGRNSGVECLLPKQDVVGSNPIARSTSPCIRHGIAPDSSHNNQYKEQPYPVGGLSIFKEVQIGKHQNYKMATINTPISAEKITVYVIPTPSSYASR